MTKLILAVTITVTILISLGATVSDSLDTPVQTIAEQVKAKHG